MDYIFVHECLVKYKLCIWLIYSILSPRLFYFLYISCFQTWQVTVPHVDAEILCFETRAESDLRQRQAPHMC